MKYVVIIPARYESTRLPGKPLVSIAGVPMIVRTWQQCVKATDADRVYVATDDERVKNVCDENGIQVIMTSSKCLTGTDRIAECSEKLDADVFINVQGDEPVFNPVDLVTLIREASMNPDSILNGYSPIKNEDDYWSSSVPKVVFSQNGKLLYMSRGPIPSNKEKKFTEAWRQVCAYSFPRKALQVFHSSERKTPFEEIEDIEILRFLELGFDVKMVLMSDLSIPVDNPEDVSKVERMILESKNKNEQK